MLDEVLVTQSEKDFLIKCISRRKTSPPERYISKWIEGLRIYPVGTPFPGPHRNSRVPYAVEIMDGMSIYDPVQYIDVMKGAQLGLTAAMAENVIGYYMGEYPAEVLYVSSTEDLLNKWVQKRLEPLIDSCDLRKLIRSTQNAPGSRSTGDKTFSKQYFGGGLDAASAQSASSLRSDSKRIVILDEVDGAPAYLRTGEGRWTEVAEGRTLAWDGRQKIGALSTPTEIVTSEIFQRYLLGDQRLYLVKCPFCGKEQPLDHDAPEGARHGLKPVTEAGILVDAVYLCEFCHDAMHNHHKALMLPGGRWVPQIENADPNRRSYQISSLYSPIGMFNWVSYWRKYTSAMSQPDGMRAFTNLYKGMPYRETGSRPILENIIELRGAYLPGTVPDGVIIITVGLDVQRGSETDKTKPPRLELEILGTGLGYRTWSIDYKVFIGAVDDPQGGAWAALQDFVDEGGLSFITSSGKPIAPSMVLMDANDNFSTSAVYEFTSKWGATHPIRGAQALKQTKKTRSIKSEDSDSIDRQTHANVKRFKWIKSDNDIRVLMISTVYYKMQIYRRLKLVRADVGDQPVGFMDFPIGYSDEYFSGLVAEEVRHDGSFYCPSSRANEPLDCKVYAMCAADVYLDQYVTLLRAQAKERGIGQADIQTINSKVALQRIAARLAA